MVSAERLERVELSEDERSVLAADARYSVRIGVAARAVDVRFFAKEACAAFARRYRDHITRDEALFSYFVGSDGSSLYFWSDRSQPWRWPDRATPEIAAFLADAAVISAVVRSDPSLVSLHAAVVGLGDRIAAIGGNSMAGKSTTAIACVRAGMRFYSDERLLMRGETVFPFQRACALRPGGRRLLANDGVADEFARWLEATRGDPPSDVSISELFGGRTIGTPGRLTAAFVLSGYAQRPVVTQMSRFEAMPTLFRWMDGREGNFSRLARLASLLSNVACFSLVLGTPAESADAVAATLESLALRAC
jgi:hypothetical protein